MHDQVAIDSKTLANLDNIQQSLAPAILEILGNQEIGEAERLKLLSRFDELSQQHQMALLNKWLQDKGSRSTAIFAADECCKEFDTVQKHGVQDGNKVLQLKVSGHKGSKTTTPDVSGEVVNVPLTLVVSMVVKQPVRMNLVLGSSHLSMALRYISDSDMDERQLDSLDADFRLLQEKLNDLQRISQFPLCLLPESARKASDFASDAEAFLQRTRKMAISH